MKKIKFLLVALASFALLHTGCSNMLSDSVDSSVEYGSLTVKTGTEDSEDANLKSIRAIDMADLAGTTATVTVSGSSMSSISRDVTINSDGSGTFTIDSIPVGKNRIVTVKSKLDGAVLRGLADIESGSGNTTTVTWDTTAVANVYAELLKLGENISNYGDTEKSAITKMIPSDTHASLVNAEKIASDYKNGTSSGSYFLNYGTVKVNATSVNDYTVQVTDVASKKIKITEDGETSFKAYPGEWKVYVYDKNENKVASKDVVIVSGKETTINVSYVNGEVSFADKTIIFVKASSAPTIWAWENNGVSLSEKAGGTWGTSSEATLMTAATSDYMTSPDGWYMIDYTSYATGKVINFKLNWTGSEITGQAGTFWYDGSTCTSTNPSPVTKEGLDLSVVNPDVPVAAVKVYVSATSAPTIWIWQASGLETTTLMGYTWSNQPTMTSATGLNDSTNWYVFELDSSCYTAGKDFTFILNSNSGNISSGKSATFWYDALGVCGNAKAFYDSDPTTVPEPVKPTVTLSPATGSIVRTTGSISVTFTNGNDTITSAKVKINNQEFDMETTAGTFTKSLSDLGITEGDVTISVSASVINGKGTTTESATYTSKYVDTSKVDTFTWDNVNAYFVLTDRFYNGDTKNDHSYYRQNADNNSTLASGYNNVATFHGGDIAGLTQKLEYLNKLGVNAIWITAPYEQAHGWCSGGGNGFPHYAFHGYYTQDWTYMDQNMGTIEEFRTFVNKAHELGIRIVMDVVMNHTAYNTVEDMITYDFGNFNTTPTHGWLGSGSWQDNHTITNYSSQGKWGNWWGCWVRAFNDQSWYKNAGYAAAGSGDITGSLSGLPDVVTEKTDSVSIPTFLKTKWNNEADSTAVPSATGNTTGNKYGDYKLSSVSNVDWYSKSGDWRTDNKGAPTDYQVIWLSGWVREFGIDGFRCDTAKHIDMYRWGQLKKACQSALEAWRKDSSKEDTAGAKSWDESFWMTGECFGWTSTAGSGNYYTTGGFDSMINFSFNGSADSGTSSSYPSSSTWSSYLSINNNSDSDSNGNRNNVLTYISSHDTRLCRASNQAEAGTMLTLLPGGIQIYYGDETNRSLAYTSCGDTDMMTRGDFNWNAAEGDLAKHWGKVGTFRKYNPAVGAGTGSATKRTYTGAAGESKVAIGISGTSVDVSGLFDDGTTVYNWYDGNSATVSSGKVTSFSGGTTSQPILISDKNPKDFGVTF